MIKIGVVLKYHHLDDGRNILYLAEKVRQTIQEACGFVIPIVPVQNVDYYDTRFDQFPSLTENEKRSIDVYLDMVDGVVFPGGNKISQFDIYLLKRCVERNIPTLGICLGMQLMSCFEKDFEVYPNDGKSIHYQKSDEGFSHTVKIHRDTLLYKIIEEDEILVNSFHRYHVGINQNYVVNAVSDDGYIEGIELPNHVFHMGVQWHPEISYSFDKNSKKIIDYFIKICGK